MLAVSRFSHPFLATDSTGYDGATRLPSTGIYGVPIKFDGNEPNDPPSSFVSENGPENEIAENGPKDLGNWMLSKSIESYRSVELCTYVVGCFTRLEMIHEYVPTKSRLKFS